MKLRIELTREDLQRLVVEHIQEKLGSMSFNKEDVKIETKSRQNYKAEWETADFRAVYEKS